MPTRTASAEWSGTLKAGSGTMRMASGAYEGPYTFASRFENGNGTNPEELVAAAHAGCFSMALAADLEAAGFNPQHVATTAEVSVLPDGGGFTIKTIVLNTEASVEGIDEARFQEVVAGTKNGCPVSRLVTGAEVTVNARLLAAHQG